jgi:soluble lytic murein transglycosylase
LQSVRIPPPPAAGTFDPDPATRLRVERARLLASAALDQWADSELRFGARTDSRPGAVAIELARLATDRGAPDLGIRFIKNLAPGHLNWSIDAAPQQFWRFAYPIPFREPLERFAKEQSLDTYLVAGLIRQESEFNPKAVSRARAVGLTQVLPSTGRQISRKLRLGFQNSLLYQPEFNLRLGTYHLRQVLNQFDGRVVAALAAYNAGESRAVAWLTWGDFREPAEFVETIPFSETRNYVQTVLRNADFYRRLYAGSIAAVPSASGPSNAQTVRGSGAAVSRPPAIP